MDGHRALTQLFLSTPTEVLRSGLDAEVVQSSRAFFTAVADWLRAQGWDEAVRLSVVLALWTGPTQEYARHRLADPDADLTGDAADALADGAWRALAPLLTAEAT